MTISKKQFRQSLYAEHLEEISCLYEQRLSLLADPELPWPDLDDFDSRREAHQNALTIGGELALAWAVQQCAQGDFGELFGAISLLCRQDRFDLFKCTLESADPNVYFFTTSMLHNDKDTPPIDIIAMDVKPKCLWCGKEF